MAAAGWRIRPAAETSGWKIRRAQQPEEEQASILGRAGELATAHAIKSLGGGTAEEAYDAAGAATKHVIERTLGPYEQVRERFPQIVKPAETLAGIGRAIPRTIDAMYTPLGAAVTVALPGAGNAIKAGVGAGFGAMQAKDTAAEAKAFIKDPSYEGAGRVIGSAAMTALPVAHAGWTIRRTNQMARQKPIIEEPPPPPADAGPVRKGPAYPAAESAETLGQVAVPFKSARESAAVFESAPPPPPGRRIPLELIAEETQPTNLPVQPSAPPPRPPLWQEAQEVRRHTPTPPSPVETLPPEAAPKSPKSRRESQRGSISFAPTEKAAKPIEEDYLNFRRLRVSPAEETNLRAEVRKAVQEQGLDPKAVEPHAAIVEAAKSIDSSLVRAVGPTGIQTRAARFAMRQRINTLNRETVEMRQKLATERDRMAPGEAMEMERAVTEKENNLKNYIGEWAGIRTEDGRNLAMHRIMADSTWDAAHWVDRARRAAGLPPGANLPEAVDTKIRGILVAGEKAQATGDTKILTEKKAQLAREVANLEQTGWHQTLVSFIKAGLLTGPKTHARNIGGNFAFQLMEETSRIPSSIVDIVQSTFSKRRTVAGASVKGMTEASRSAATKGVQDAWQILKQGATTEDLAKMDQQRELNFQKLGAASPIINKYVNGVFRLLSAEDRVFRQYAMTRSIEAQAKVTAMNEARQKLIPEKQIIRRTNELAAKPTETMATQAVADAEFATFNNQNFASAGMSGFKALVHSTAQKMSDTTKSKGPLAAADAFLFGVETTVPFVRTPANVAARLADYSVGAPVKAGYHIIKSISDGLTPQHQKAISEAVGRGSVGAGLILLGYYKAQKGEATGTGQIPPGQKAVEEAAGRQPGAIRLGNSWHRLSPFSPVGNLITIGASLFRETGGLKEAAKRPGTVAKIAGRTVLEQPMLQGVQEMVHALENPEARGERLIEQRAGMLVPTGVRDIGTAIDPTRRETPKGAGASGAAWEGIKERTPGLQSTLPARTDVLGRPLEASRSAAVNPFLSSTAKEATDPVTRELVRLNIGVSKSARSKDEPDEEYRIRVQVRGRLIEQAVKEVVSDSRYASAGPDVQKDAIVDAVREAQREAALIVRDARYKNAPPPQRLQMLQGVLQQLTQ